MSTLTTKQLLHVEDDPMQQRVLVHHLKSMEEFRFETTAVPSEDEAMVAFRAGRFDLVLVDYQLAQGNGLHLLERLRQLDPVIPIIAISAVATSEVAADLVRAGADDYFDKRDLTSGGLARSVRAALLRAETVRKRMQHPAGTVRGQITHRLLELCQYFTEKVGPELVGRLDALEKEARQAGLSAVDLEQLYLGAITEMEKAGTSGPLPTQQVLRLLMLELIVRVSGDLTEHDFDEIAHGS